MSRTLQFRRYNSATIANTTGANGELIINSTNQTITVHDGVTPGGYATLNSVTDNNIDQYARNTANTATNNITIIQGVNTTQNTNITTATNLAQFAFNTANTATNNITIIQGVNTTQNTNITTATNLAQSAFNTANNANTRTIISGLGVSKLDFATYGSNTAYLTTTNDDSTALSLTASSAELYANTNVVIRANTKGTSQNWTFGEDGSLTFPDSTIQTTAWTGSAIDQTARNTANTATNNITIIQGVNTTQNTNITTANNHAWAAFTKANNALANTTGTFAGNLNVDGFITLNTAGGIYQETASPSIMTANTTGIFKIVTNRTIDPYTWTFAQNGNTTFPTGVRLSNARGPNTVNFTTDTDKSFQIETGTSITNKLWNFQTNGNLTLPQSGTLTFSDSTIQNTAFTGSAIDQTARDIANTKLSLSGGTISGNVTANSVIANNSIYSPIYYSTGATTNLTLSDIGLVAISVAGQTYQFGASGIESNQGVFGGTFGGNRLSLNSETNLISNRLDTVKIQTGTTGTTVNDFTFANNTFSVPGLFTTVSANITSTTVSTSNTTGALKVAGGVGVKGNVAADGIIFPDNTIQNTAYVPVTGSWTITTGANTYSFTVPSDGTYTMWVKGNIANGIIIWNATLSISNSNVPAIGTQYAWNYTGGGSPILLTTLPDQIRGTANTISTDNTYAGTTSNRFDFGISNSSGSSQTIYYGYTKI